MYSFSMKQKPSLAYPPARSAVPEQSRRKGQAGGNAQGPTTGKVAFGHDFSRIPVLSDKSVDGHSDSRFGLVEDKGPDAGVGPGDAGAPVAAPKKKAGVDSFVVKWSENAGNSATTAKLRLDYSAKFKKDGTHDPAVAEFRQNAFHTFEVTAGPHKGQKHSNPPLHDDNYSRADDTGGNGIGDVDFVSNDNPGPVVNSLDKDDVIDYSFTAEQMIIDTGDSNKVVAKRGPHTATIKGKDPRVFADVPKTLS